MLLDMTASVPQGVFMELTSVHEHITVLARESSYECSTAYCDNHDVGEGSWVSRSSGHCYSATSISIGKPSGLTSGANLQMTTITWHSVFLA